jgi:hypothetical protein
LSGKKIEVESREEGGPLGWLLPTVESAHTNLRSRGTAAPVGLALTSSSLEPEGGSVLAVTAPTAWRDIFLEYKRRKSAAMAPVVAPMGAAPAAPVVPGARNWLPLGPTVILNGQTVGDQPVAGRVSGLAIAPGGGVIYAASANGGVFRSLDGGTSWQSTMDGFDLNPTSFATASLTCGAIALDAADPKRVYVGTGEGDTLQLFRSRITNALPAYRGLGPIRTDDGGSNWIPEASTPDLAGEAFFALAVDPRNRENVLGATTKGLYRRVPKPGGQFEWRQVRTGVHSSVTVTFAGGVTRFFCAQWGQTSGSPSGAFYSDDDGATWVPAGTAFPTGSGRIALGVQPTNPNLAYAFVAERDTGIANGLYRWDGGTKPWKKVGNLPDVLPVNKGRSQGDYDLAIAVDPSNINLLYLGGSYANVNPYPGSVWRCEIKTVASDYAVSQSASIGTHAHADVHVLVHTPNTPDELWCTCDGGVFLNRNPRGTGQFASQNNGLSCLCSNFMTQHPTDPNILFTGLQDNGTARTATGPIWSHVSGGDGGYCLINWADPNLVLVYSNDTVYRSTVGGTSVDSWSSQWKFPWATMTQPLVGLPYNPSKPAEGQLVAAAAGQMVYISDDFAASWAMSFTISGGSAAGQIFALAFASASRLYAATTTGRVFRADRSGTSWSVTQLDNAAIGPLGLEGLINDVAIDWTDASLSSIYITFGGKGDRRRVWRFDGAKWEVRSGAAGGNDLLDVEHNAIVVDRVAPNNVYVGADIGVWRSSDGGRNWHPMENGLPDAPVFDLQIHPTQRLLRATTHGRGLYEIALD